MEEKTNEKGWVGTTVSIKPEQKRYLEENHIKLSSVVQEAIDRYIKEHN